MILQLWVLKKKNAIRVLCWDNFRGFTCFPRIFDVFWRSWRPLGLILALLATPRAHFGSPGGSWGSFWALLAAPGAHFWLSWRLLGLILALLAAPGAHSGAPGGSWGSFGLSWRLLGLILPLLAAPGDHFRPPGSLELPLNHRKPLENSLNHR